MSDLAAEQKSGGLQVLGAKLQPLPEGALYWPERETLIVADLHFEKGSAFAAKGVLLPPYDTTATLARLERLCRVLSPSRVIALGDSFHDGEALARMEEGARERIRALAASTDWIWIEGNHDPAPPPFFGGSVESAVDMKPLIFRHEPQAAPATGEVAGHLHPCAAVRVRGRRLRRRCFASDGTRLIMPSFGAYTGGLNVLDAAFAPLFAGLDFHAWMIGTERIHPVKARTLLPDGGSGKG